MPQFINCAGQYMAWNSPSNCTHTDVGVKTENQLGGKPTRAVWTINGEARKNLNIVGDKDCVNNVLDISLRGIVLTRVKFPWQIKPVGNDCNTVTINAPTRNGAKYLGMRMSSTPGSCSKSFTFTSTSGPQNVFKLVKAS
jgi:hypothetical protein